MSRLPGVTVEERLLLNSVREGDCLRWTGAHKPSGYGQIWVDDRMRSVHRIAHELWVGPIPPELEVDHVRSKGCRYRDCIEPRHLEAVTRAENLRRQPHDGPSDTCSQGHRIDDDNAYVHTSGRRECLTCKRARWTRREPCPHCGDEFSASHLKRHIQRKHSMEATR